MRLFSGLARASLVPIVLSSALACGGSEGSPSAPGTSGDRLSLALSPRTETVEIGQSRVLTARVTDAQGMPRAVAIEWRSLNPTIATVSGGTVIGVAAGSAQVEARYGQLSDTATISVIAPAFELRVTPSASIVSLGDTLQFEALIESPAGAALRNIAVQWQLSDSTLGAFVSDGKLETKGEGDLSLIAHAAGQTATAQVRVTATPVAAVALSPSNSSIYVDATQQFTARVTDDRGRVLSGREVIWRSSDSALVTVSATGKITGRSKGAAVITARASGKSASATVNVLSTPASTVTIVLSPDTMAAGSTGQATAAPRDAQGALIDGRTVAWQSSNPSVATINSSGRLNAMTPGGTTISAIVDGRVASSRLSVQQAVATSIAITPATLSLLLGTSGPLSAEVRDQFGAAMASTAVVWTSLTPSIASVSAAGVVSTVSFGTATIRATAGTLSSTATVTVLSVPVANLSASPSSLQLVAGASSALTATPRDASGGALANRSITWSSSNPTVATVSATGVVSGISAGSASISATSEGKSIAVSVVVTAPAPASVQSVSVSFNAPAIQVGQATQAIARALDGNGNVLQGRALSYQSEDPSLASVDANGLVTAIAAGSVTISATSEGVTGYATLTVTALPAAPVATVSLTTTRNALQVGEAAQTSVTLRDAQGNVLTGRNVSLSSSRASVVSISLTGVLSAISVGTATITATSEGQSAAISIAVTQPPAVPIPVATVSVSAPLASIDITKTVQAIAELRDSNGNLLASRPTTWSSSDPAIATVSASGLITGVTGGSTMITASAEGKAGAMAITITVPTATVAAVTVTIAAANLTTGQTAQATAVARDAQGSTITGRAVAWSVSVGANIAGISTAGLVTAKSAGSATVVATVDGKVGTVGVVVTQPAPPPPPPGPSPAALPQTYLSTPYIAATGQTWMVRAGDNLQTALNSAQRGDEVVLQAGATFRGTFTLPAKTGTAANGWIVVRSEALASLPGQGVRVTPANAGAMPKIVTPNYQAAIQTAAGASGWRLVGLDVSVDPAFTGQQYGIVLLGDGSSKQNTVASIATDLVLDRMYVHGATTTNGSRCIALNSARTAIIDSYIHECHGAGFDSQAIAGWNGPGPFKIVNNTLAGAGENVIFGGADPAIPNLIPSDIEFRRNYVVTPAAWKNVWLKKNLFETKNAQRLLIEGNVFDGSWAHGQVGFAFMLKSANQSGSCTWCASRDITIRNNIVRNSGAGFNLSGHEGSNPYPVGEYLRRILIENNVVENINTGVFVGEGRMVQVLDNIVDLVIRNNTMTAPGAHNTFLTLGRSAATNFEFRDNIFTKGQYGLFGDGYGEGIAALQNLQGVVTFTGVVVIGTPKTTYPAGVRFVADLAAAMAVPNAGANNATVNAATAGVVVP